MTRSHLKATATFLVVTCGFSWALLAIFFLTGGASGRLLEVVLPYSMGPLAGALYLQWRRQEKALSLLGGDPFPNLWFLAAWVIPPAVGLVVVFASPLFAPAHPSFSGLAHLEAMRSHLSAATYAAAHQRLAQTSPGLVFGAALGQALFSGATIDAVIALGEEIGWRVTLLRELAPLGFWRASLLIGLARGLWMVPLVLAGFPFPTHRLTGALLMTAFSIVASVVATFLRLKGGSVLPAALFAGGLNASSHLPSFFVLGGSERTTGLFGVTGIAVLALVALVIVLPRAGKTSRLFAPA